MEIKSLSELVELGVNGIPENTKTLKISPNLSTIEIKIEGEGYENAIPGEQLRTLWEIQHNLYKLAAYALHNNFDSRSLSTEERLKFEIRVTTSNGSWVGRILTDNFWSEAFENLMNKMTGSQIAMTITICVLMFLGYLAYKNRNDRLIAIKKEETQKDIMETIEKIVNSFNSEKDKKAEEMIKQAQATIDSAITMVAKRSHGAKQITVSGQTLDQDQIQKLKERNKTEPMQPEFLETYVQITSLDKSFSAEWSMKLVDKTNGMQINAKLVPEAIDGDGQEAKDLINNAFYHETPVKIEISMGKKRNLIVWVEE